jgi:hypothetical protein
MGPLITPLYGNWTPVLTFETPGDLSVTYTVQLGRFIKIGKLVILTGQISTSAFTHTTASGDARITGLPFTSANVANLVHTGTFLYEGITKAGFMAFYPEITSNVAYIEFRAVGTGVSLGAIQAGDLPSGGSVTFRFEIVYMAAS